MHESDCNQCDLGDGNGDGDGDGQSVVRADAGDCGGNSMRCDSGVGRSISVELTRYRTLIHYEIS